jgi:hypothetical protein
MGQPSTREKEPWSSHPFLTGEQGEAGPTFSSPLFAALFGPSTEDLRTAFQFGVALYDIELADAPTLPSHS